MRKHLALIAVGMLVVTGCAAPREHSSVEVTPPPEVEVPAQTIYHQAIGAVMDDDTIISTGVPAVETLQSADGALAEYTPEPAECAGTVDAQYYTTNDVAVGFSSQTSDDTHAAQTVVAASFETAEEATSYFNARTSAWTDCDSVDLTIDDTNVLTLHYTATAFADADELEVPEHLVSTADQDLVLTSSGELSGELEGNEAELPDPGALPDYVISPEDIPEPEAENIAVTSATVIVRIDTEVFWVLVEPGSDAENAAQTLSEIIEMVHDQA